MLKSIFRYHKKIAQSVLKIAKNRKIENRQTFHTKSQLLKLNL